MGEEKVKVYPLRIGQTQTKAMDLIDLNNFLDKRIFGSNPLLLDTDDMTIGEFRGKLAWGIVMELSRQVKIDLGIIEETPAKAEQKEMIVEDEGPEEPQPQQRQIPRPVQKQPKQEVEDLLSKNSKDDDIVVLE